MHLPEKEYFSIYEMKEKWSCSQDDIIQYAYDGLLKLSVICSNVDAEIHQYSSEALTPNEIRTEELIKTLKEGSNQRNGITETLKKTQYLRKKDYIVLNGYYEISKQDTLKLLEPFKTHFVQYLPTDEPNTIIYLKKPLSLCSNTFVGYDLFISKNQRECFEALITKTSNAELDTTNNKLSNKERKTLLKMIALLTRLYIKASDGISCFVEDRELTKDDSTTVINARIREDILDMLSSLNKEKTDAKSFGLSNDNVDKKLKEALSLLEQEISK